MKRKSKSDSAGWMSISIALMLLWSGAISAQPGGWCDGFETYQTSSDLAVNWHGSGNTPGMSVDNSVAFSGSQSLKMFGVLGSCWGVVATRPMTTSLPIDITFAVRNGTEPLSGCHAYRAALTMRSGGPDWWNCPCPMLLLFLPNGDIQLPSTGNQLFSGYPLETWHQVKCNLSAPGDGFLHTKYWVNGQYLGDFTIPFESWMNGAAYLDISAQEGTVWFDDVCVKPAPHMPWCDGFEGGLVNWIPYQYPSGWTSTTSDPHSGQTCAAFTFPSGAGYYDASMRSAPGLFYAEAGVTYSVSYWIREQNTHDTWDANQSILDIGMDIGTGGANDRIAPFALPISSEWHFIVGTVTASASGAAAINVELHGYATSNDALFAIDDICIRPSPPPVTTVAFDIRPGACPNPYNVKSALRMEMPVDSNAAVQVGKLAPLKSEPSKDVLPTAILGTATFDVSSIDIGSIRLLGVAPVRSAFEDVATPVSAGAQECACNSFGLDGYSDLTLKFYRDDIAAALGTMSVGDTKRLKLTGKLKDGSDFEGHDCILIVGNPNAVESTGDNPIALANYPNPFNPVTTISFAMPQAGYAKLDIYNSLGQLVATLVDERLETGVHTVTWDASNQASGLYLYRLTTSDLAETKKMLLLK